MEVSHRPALPVVPLELRGGAVLVDANNQHAWHLYMLRVDNERLHGGRDVFVEELRKRKIGASVHFIPLHLHPYYRDTYHYKPDDFPVATREYSREISLPIYSRMTDADVNDVIGAVLETAELIQR